MNATALHPTMSPRARVASLVLVALAVLAVGLVQVASRRAQIRVGYQLSAASSEMREIEEEQRRLQIELSVLTAPERIEGLAKELGMVPASPSDIRVVNRAAPLARAE
jgi:cell division protein FtsL